jgi:hypothetical protein
MDCTASATRTALDSGSPPRNPRSTWSRTNRQRPANMIEQGLMTEHGQALIDLARANGPGRSYPTRRPRCVASANPVGSS